MIDATMQCEFSLKITSGHDDVSWNVQWTFTSFTISLDKITLNGTGCIEAQGKTKRKQKKKYGWINEWISEWEIMECN